MSSPTISLCMIVKNEEKNLARVLDSVEGCMDEIVIVDTGSTDRTKEIAGQYGCKVFDFKWIDNFAAARNFSFSQASKDFIIWLDADDVLFDKEAFKNWKSNAMQFIDYWFATYNYALDKDGKPIVSFVRERVFKRSIEAKWRYALHEGVICEGNWSRHYALGWAVNHLRDAEDIKADKSRNIKIIEQMKDRNELDGRMHFYYGKELFEAGRALEAVPQLEHTIKQTDLELHDKVLAYQYGAYASGAAADMFKDDQAETKARYHQKAIDFALEGLKHDPSRAEFWVILGDTQLKKGNLPATVPMYSAAKNCMSAKQMGSPYEGAIYSFLDCYGQLPSIQLAKVYFHMGMLDKAAVEALECSARYSNAEAEALCKEIERIKPLVTIDRGQSQTEDIVFTCPPHAAYPFDEEVYKTKGMGGSETALIEMARGLKKLTGRAVKVFNVRDEDLVAESGVEYISNKKLNAYMSENKPRAHIAWRHNIQCTKAPTYLWCHDLVTQGVEGVQNFDKILCLSEFHKNYVRSMQAVPEDKIIVTRNGINPEKFANIPHGTKNPNKLVWMSSPDRGLDRAMLVCDRVLRQCPDIELHVYNWFANEELYGMKPRGDKLRAMMQERPYVKFHGFTEQTQMYREVSDAVVWIHPCDFIESYCITCNEMLALGIYPVTRKLGALANTLADAESKGQAILLDHDCITDLEIQAYADATIKALKEKKWESIDFDLNKHSWDSVAKEWTGFMEL